MASKRVVVVGGGLAGSIVAERLSRDCDRQVVLLEGGQTQADLHVLALPDDQPDGAVQWWPTAQGMVPRGRGIGGSAAINGAVWVPWHREEMESYAGGDLPRYRELAQQCAPTRVVARSPVTAAAEKYWEAQGFGHSSGEWAQVGINRVSTTAMRRGTTWRRRVGVPGRENLEVRAGTAVRGIADIPDADEVIICAGTFGTAELLWNVNVLPVDHLPLREHREQRVSFRVAQPLSPGELVIESVLHTEDGLEMRPYTVPFGDRYSIGVADMMPGSQGSIRRGDASGIVIDLGEPDRATLASGCARVVQMLESADFADLLVPESIRIEPEVGTSHHACATLVASAGRVPGAPWLRVVDASILPSARSGPVSMLSVVAAGC